MSGRFEQDRITENKVGWQCYNPNSYNGWTGEEGCSFRYPVWVSDMKDNPHTSHKYYGAVPDLRANQIKTMKYKFGSNHLYIGDGLVEVVEFLEERYGLDFMNWNGTERKK